MKLILAIIALLLLGSAQAATLTVCSNGCDYSSIQAAVNAAEKDDVIEIHSGTYYERLNISKIVTLIGVDTGSGMPIVDSQNLGPGIELSSSDFCIVGIYFRNTLFADIYAISAHKISLVKPEPESESFAPLINRTMPGSTPDGFQVFGNMYIGKGVVIKTDGGLFVDEVLDNPASRKHIGILMHSSMQDGDGVKIYMGDPSVFEKKTVDQTTSTETSTQTTGRPSGQENVFTGSWLADVLQRHGYIVTNQSSTTGHEFISTKNPSGYKVQFDLASNLKMILMTSYWTLKENVRADDSGLLIAMEKANAASWYNTYTLTKDGTTLRVNSYVTLFDRTSEDEIIDFFTAQWRDFKKNYANAGLDYYTVTGELY
ncbi:MAG TPA: hypothetical protein PLI05_00250 [Methanotrichaceae archaeon]|nr:hypothetical protein [Methanotrichaceae archaeon]HQF15483.1 hypothetical protein [Methanotrichaceae archaeon]HQI90218.1 hypothetical protein [Methanotrichaceae archaeon]HQJ27813.1 hypothetical protein [Methanotrichaceae archaeon]